MKEKVKTYYIDLVKGKRKGALEALFSFLLLLLSFIYGFFVKLILSCYEISLFKSYKPDCRVVSVGNISWGGTGKTPLVEALARFFKQEGKNPAILIRGYGKDEVDMLKSRFSDIPVLADRDRIKTAKEAYGCYRADTIILDDGFQHWRLGRDLDIVLIDSKTPFGNRRLIPRGILREPLSSLIRADVFILTNSNLAKENIELIKKELHKYNNRAPIYEAIHAPDFLGNLASGEKVEPSTMKSKRIALLCGIANPDSFENTLNLLDVEISLRFCFADHYQYNKEDLKRIQRQCLEKQIESIITTEKDAARLIPLLKPERERLKVKILALGVKFKIVKDEDKFFASLRGDKNNQEPYSILILSDGKAGHLNQSKAVAKIIQKRKTDQGLGAEAIKAKIVEVKFKNGLSRALLGFCSIFANPGCGRCLRCLRFCLNNNSFEKLMQSPADIIVSTGSSLSSVNLYLSYRNKARKVVLMKPSFLSLDKFDLMIIPQHDRIKKKENVLQTVIAPNLIDRQYLKEQASILKNRLEAQKQSKIEAERSIIGVLIGGDTPKYRMTLELVNKIIFQLKEVAQKLNCQLLVTTSRRTPKIVEKLLKENLGDFGQCKLLVIANEKNIPEAVGGILGLSEIIIVSGESISMASEATSAERYVLVFEAQKKVISQTKQERFLEKLEKAGFIKVVRPEALSSEIEKIWKDRPKKKKIQDKELIYQALGRILQN